MKPIATDFGDVHLRDRSALRRGRAGRPGAQCVRLNVDTARQRLREAGFQVADQPTSVNSSASYGTVVGTSPSGQTFRDRSSRSTPATGLRRHRRHLRSSAPPDFPGLPPEVGMTVVEIPGLPPITVPIFGPPPPAEPPPA